MKTVDSEVTDLAFQCGQCGQEMSYPYKGGGHKFRCPTCLRMDFIPPQENASPRSSGGSPLKSGIAPIMARGGKTFTVPKLFGWVKTFKSDRHPATLVWREELPVTSRTSSLASERNGTARSAPNLGQRSRAHADRHSKLVLTKETAHNFDGERGGNSNNVAKARNGASLGNGALTTSRLYGFKNRKAKADLQITAPQESNSNGHTQRRRNASDEISARQDLAPPNDDVLAGLVADHPEAKPKRPSPPLVDLLPALEEIGFRIEAIGHPGKKD